MITSQQYTQFTKLVTQIETTEEVQQLLQELANHLSDAYDATGGDDEALKQATLHLMAAHDALNKRSGR